MNGQVQMTRVDLRVGSCAHQRYQIRQLIMHSTQTLNPYSNIYIFLKQLTCFNYSTTPDNKLFTRFFSRTCVEHLKAMVGISLFRKFSHFSILSLGTRSREKQLEL